MKILVTGFDPFGNEPINPAIEAVKCLPDKILGAEIIKLEIPTVIGCSLDVIAKKVEEVQPDAVVSVGQAGGRVDLTIERVGINCDDCRIKDNDGNQPIDVPVAKGGPDAYLLTLPIKAMVDLSRKAGVPASISNSAGTFVCNHVAYGVAHLAATKYPHMQTGFIHIPFLPEQVIDKPNTASMALETTIKGLTACLEAVVRFEEDLVISGGKEH